MCSDKVKPLCKLLETHAEETVPLEKRLSFVKTD
jgi:hypothetical protein